MTLIDDFMDPRGGALRRRTTRLRKLPRGPLRIFERTLLKLLAASALAVLGGEAYFRAIDFPFQVNWLPVETPLIVFDGELGWRYRPLHTALVNFGEERVAVHFDALGARVTDPGRRLVPGAPTAVFVGDSFTMGHGVAHQKSFPGQLERREDFPFQVVNLGVQGYGTDQALLALRRHADRFDTRLVVYTLNDVHLVQNEVYDRRELYRGARFLGTKPLFALADDGVPFLLEKPVRYEELRYSRVLATLRILRWRYGPSPSAALTIGLIGALQEEARAAGATFVLVYWDDVGRRRLGEPPDAGALARLLEESFGASLIDLAVDAPPELDAWSREIDSHPAPRAHAYVARRIVEHLERVLPRTSGSRSGARNEVGGRPACNGKVPVPSASRRRGRC